MKEIVSNQMKPFPLSMKARTTNQKSTKSLRKQILLSRVIGLRIKLESGSLPSYNYVKIISLLTKWAVTFEERRININNYFRLGGVST